MIYKPKGRRYYIVKFQWQHGPSKAVPARSWRVGTGTYRKLSRTDAVETAFQNFGASKNWLPMVVTTQDALQPSPQPDSRATLKEP